MSLTLPQDQKHFLFVVDTDSYAGSFERQMCGYITGQHDGTHGEEEAEVAHKELPDWVSGFFENSVDYRRDDKGHERRATIWPTPGWFNHGMGGHFRDGQEAEAFEDHKREVAEYVAKYPTSDVKAGDKLVKHPAYMSVAIFLRERPEQEIIDLMKERAKKFVQFYRGIMNTDSLINISGFRIVEEEVIRRFTDTPI